MVLHRRLSCHALHILIRWVVNDQCRLSFPSSLHRRYMCKKIELSLLLHVFLFRGLGGYFCLLMLSKQKQRKRHKIVLGKIEIGLLHLGTVSSGLRCCSLLLALRLSALGYMVLKHFYVHFTSRIYCILPVFETLDSPRICTNILC